MTFIPTKDCEQLLIETKKAFQEKKNCFRFLISLSSTELSTTIEKRLPLSSPLSDIYYQDGYGKGFSFLKNLQL